MVELLGLGGLMRDKVGKLSKGMQERVALGLTFSRNTSVYLLDEPLGGIDPVGKAKIIDAILSMQLEDSSIVVSTHLVKDIERIFDSVHFISRGRIAFSGDCDRMREENGKTVEQAYLEVFAYEGTV
jgi:ABC-2 type transport system ATP-binding protein